jgi:hypothetical protein
MPYSLSRRILSAREMEGTSGGAERVGETGGATADRDDGAPEPPADFLERVGRDDMRGGKKDEEKSQSSFWTLNKRRDLSLFDHPTRFGQPQQFHDLATTR